MEGNIRALLMSPVCAILASFIGLCLKALRKSVVNLQSTPCTFDNRGKCVLI
jgi:hypothetical protein